MPDYVSVTLVDGQWIPTPADQPLDTDLTSIAALSTTPFGRGVLDDADAATLRTTAGLVIGSDVEAWNGLGFVETLPIITSNAVGAWPSANRGIYARCRIGGTITKIGFEVGTSSGNVSVAVFRKTGTGTSAAPTGAPVNSSGAVACPATGYQEVSLAASTTVAAGDYLFLSCDNTTATFIRHGSGSATTLTAPYFCHQTSAHPATTAASLSNAGAYCPILRGVP